MKQKSILLFSAALAGICASSLSSCDKQPQEPVQVAELVEPTQTAKPAQSEKAAEPSAPSKPAETEKTEPTPEPEAPAAPTEPTETIQPTEPDVPKVDASTMTGKVMCGYQGWFRAANDGEKQDWKHYRNQTSRQFKPGEAGIEFWPDLTEFGDHERFDTEFRHADGSVAQVFSSAVRDTVVRHFKWMREYGIDGVFVQRFATEVTNPNGGRADNDESRSVTKVLQHCRAGAARHGRTYAVMYDLTSMSAARMAAVKDDWRFLVKELGILKDPSYQRHAGRPVLALWGVGFRNRDYGPAQIAPLIDFLKNDPECGGLTIMLGTPTHWRAGERDAGPFADWEKIYKSVDIISPWTIGRYGRINEAQNYAANIAKPDHEWCVANNKEHMPVVFPGFSWSNLKKGTDENPDAFIDRLGGKFLWSQYDAVVRVAGAKMVYQAMFDEIDEGIHIFKSTNNPPVGASRFLTYDGLPTDHYLWLVGEATRRVRGEAPFTPELPVSRFDKARSDTTHHKALYKQINDNLNSFNKQSITRKLNGVSYWLDGWFKDGEAMKIVAKAQKPDDHMGTEEYYIENSQPLFVFRVSDMLDLETGKVMKRRAENRFYFRDGRLFKWLKWDKSEMSPHEEIFGHEGEILSTKCREFISEFGSSSIKNKQEDNNFLDEREWLNAHGKSAAEYFDYLSSLQLKRISVEEVIKVHAVKKAEIWNSIPPKSSWRRMGYTLRVVERIAQEMGVDHVDIITAYRSPAYNKQCVRSDCGFDQPNSWHQQNIAVDFSFPGISPDKVTKMAKQLRDEGLFRGAVGTHGNFTHLDARGVNIDLP